MQIHLFDCKSMHSLRSGLGNNKLSLCMLVLSQLRKTYWSASVIHRLFERAQIMLRKHKSGASSLAEKLVDSDDPLAYSNNQFLDTENLQQRHHQQRPHHHQEQQQDNREHFMQHVPRANLSLNEHNISFWPNDTPFFNNVDQLLSPSFSISDSHIRSFWTDYDSGLLDIFESLVSGPHNGSHNSLRNI